MAASDIEAAAAAVATAQKQRFADALRQLEDEEATELANEILLMVLNGEVPMGEILEAMEAAETFARSEHEGELSDEQVSQLIQQMAVRHATGVAG